MMIDRLKMTMNSWIPVGTVRRIPRPPFSRHRRAATLYP